MECPHCKLPMQRHAGKNGKVFYKCPICGYEEDTDELDIQSMDSIEAYKEEKE